MRLTIFICMTLLLAACVKETVSEIENEINPPISEIPVIDSVEVWETTVQQYVDSLVLVVHYIDGDGDLGFEDPDETAIEVVDTRDEDLLVFRFPLSPRAPIGAAISIQGSLNLVLPNTILLDQNNEQETTQFGIRLRDRANNWSEWVYTPVITILRD